MSPDYQLELIDLQSSDAMPVAFRYTHFDGLWQICQPATFVNLRDNVFDHASTFGSTFGSSTKAHMKSTWLTMLWLRLLSALSKVFKMTVELIDHSLLNSKITLCIDAMIFLP